MPTLFRFLGVLLLLGGLAFGGMIALVAFVEPETREIVVTIPTPPRPAPSPAQ